MNEKVARPLRPAFQIEGFENPVECIRVPLLCMTPARVETIFDVLERDDLKDFALGLFVARRDVAAIDKDFEPLWRVSASV